MNKYGLTLVYIKNLKPNYNKKVVEENSSEDQLRRDFNQRGWATDITYQHLVRNGKKEYYSTIIYLETRNWIA